MCVLLLMPLMRTTGGADCTVALFDLDGAGEKQPASIRYASLAASPPFATAQSPATRFSWTIVGPAAAVGVVFGRLFGEVQFRTWDTCVPHTEYLALISNSKKGVTEVAFKQMDGYVLAHFAARAVRSVQ